MSIGTILVAMASTEEAGRLLEPACMLARRLGAHLTGVHVIEAMDVYPGVAMHVSMPASQAVRQSQRDHADRLRAVFEQRTGPEDFVAEWRQVETHALAAPDAIAEQARGADLVILGQTDPAAQHPGSPNAAEPIIRQCGRPVLVIPYAGTHPHIGRHALVGWSPTREATRAAFDALNLIEPDGKATILTAHQARRHDPRVDESARNLALAYDRHGVRAEVVDRPGDGLAVGTVLLNEASDRGADLIVTGAFGHSRLYDFVIGAVTTHLLGSMTVPVLFSA